MSSDFPYAMHVEVIQRALWRPRSRAAVMVGSGFSRNAEAITGAAPPFPLWRELTDRLKKELRESYSDDALRLAEEYEHAVGRTALDDLLLNLIPDGKYQPGRLHEMLLSLPWAEVFTTNYDTLLERTRPKVQEARYDLVLNAADIARSERPRIVKLHGSFPSQRPFILSAEDYRKYPTDFAPFVNMVRQSIMENVFCMIGFSGNDPNFMQWIGWVRDQLGAAAPKIYLCDVLDLSPAKERYYQSMRVIPIDLGPLVPRTKWTEELRRPKALEWLLISLHNGRPPELHQWPERPVVERARFQLDDRLPRPLMPPELPRWVVSPILRDIVNVDRDSLKRLAESWRSEREGYPGWMVIPEVNRKLLLMYTERWLDEPVGAGMVQALAGGQLAERAEFLYELVWRIQRALVPLPSWLVNAVSTLLVGFNPKPDLIKFKGLAAEPEIPSGNTDALTAIWVELAFALLNHAWQEQLDGEFELWLDRLKDVVRLKPEWQARWYHEQCWRRLLQLDEDGVRSILGRWPEQLGLPFWEAKRAALYAELGDTEEALHIAEAALERIRQGTGTASIDYVSLSQEGWIIQLINLLELAREELTGSQQREALVARLRELRTYRCDPYEDGERRERTLQESSPDAGVTVLKKRGFDPGTRTTVTRYAMWQGDEWVLLQMFHDGTLPLRCDNVVTHSKGMANCMLNIWSQSDRVAIGIGLLGGRFEDLKKVLGRVDVSTLDRAVAQSIYQWLSSALLRALDSRSSRAGTSEDISGVRERLIKGCPEILSRLTLHLSPEQLESAFELSLKMYRYEPFRRVWWRYVDSISSMFKRILFAASHEQIFAWLPRLLELPIAGNNGFIVEERRAWMDPISPVRWEHGWRRPSEAEKNSWSDAVGHLIRLVQEGPSKVRERASERLFHMAVLGGLTEKQGKSFIGALWSRTDSGFPLDIGFEPWGLLDLPYERQPGDSKRAVSRYILDHELEDIERLSKSIYYATAKGWQGDEQRRSRIEWTAAEAEVLLRKILDWWARKKTTASNQPGGRQLSDGERQEVHEIIRLLGTVIIPYLGPQASASFDLVEKLLKEYQGLGISTVEILPALLIPKAAGVEEKARIIHRVLRGAREAESDEAVVAIFQWFTLARGNRVPPPPSSLLDEWVENILSRRQPGLGTALGQFVIFAERFGDELKEHHVAKLCEALGYLAEETRLSSANASPDDLPLTSEERIELRGHASRLAANLASRFKQEGRSIPPEIEAWRNIGTTDTLPEVRRAWQKLVTSSE
jgi:hypothetical protein